MTITHVNVSLRFESLAPTYSCYLCQVVGGEYCNATLDNVALSNELAYNIMVKVLGHSGPSALLDITHNDAFVITLPLDKYSCEPLNLVMLVFASVAIPSPMSFLTVVRDTNESVQRIACDDNVPLFDDIDCSVVGPYYYYVPLTTPNCIAEANSSLVPIIKGGDPKPPLYWYSETLANRLPSDVPIVLCGNLDTVTLLRGSNLSYRCGQYASLYVALRPWYALAIQYIVAQLNMRRQNVTQPVESVAQALILAHDTLERTCLLRNTEDAINNTVLAPLYNRLLAYNGDDRRDDTWCEAISEVHNRSDLDDGFIPYYLSLYKEWYFRYFSFFILYSHDMALKVMIALALLSVACGIFLCSITIAPLWILVVHCCRHIVASRRRRESQQRDALSYNDEL